MKGNWCRENMAEAVEGFRKRVKAPKPMVAVPDLSPEFLAMAIRLDVALCEYRDKFGGVKMLERLHARRFAQPNSTKPPPELARVDGVAEKVQHHVHLMISAIEDAKPVTRGDRALKRRASELRYCPRYRQLDWLFDLEHQDEEEQHYPKAATAEGVYAVGD